MSDTSSYVVDASIVLKWLFRLDDEPFQEAVDPLLRDFAAPSARTGVGTPPGELL